MKKLQFAQGGYIAMSIIFYAAALIYLIFPDLPSMLLCCFSGVILLLYGVIKIIGFFSEDLYCLAFRYDLAFGLFLMVIGVFALIRNTAIAQHLASGLGWIALLDNLFHVQMSKEARDFGLEQWKLILGLSIAAGALSVLLIVYDFLGLGAARLLACIVLLAEGVVNHCIVKLTVRLPSCSTGKEVER